MPYEIDSEKLNDPKMKVLDIANPPLRYIEHREFPKCIYRHPKDKRKEHISRVVQDREELEKLLKAGWKLKPHIPTPEVDLADTDEYEGPPKKA